MKAEDSSRRTELRRFLEAEVDALPEATDRVPWLLDQLENYLERWIGMASAMPYADPFQSDLLVMMEAAVEVLNRDREFQGTGIGREFLDKLHPSHDRDPKQTGERLRILASKMRKTSS